MKKLLIAVPCYDVMRVEFVQSLMAMTARLHREGTAHEVKIISGTLVYMARDNLARHAINNDFDYTLWIDSDMVFSDSLLEDLTVSGKDMVCANFISRHNPYLNVVFSKLLPLPAERITEIPEDTFRVAGCGFGCVLIRTRIMADVMASNGGKCFLPTPELSEDLAFCQRAAGVGCEIWCEPTARVGHVGPVTIWPEDGERFRGEIMGLEGKKLE